MNSFEPKKLNSQTKPEKSYTNGCSNFKVQPCIMTKQQVAQLRLKVLDAIRKHKIFTINGNYRSVRNALKERGWYEKRHFESVEYTTQHPTIDELYNSLPKKDANVPFEIHYKHCEEIIISKLLHYVTPDLYWRVQPGRNVNKPVIQSRFPTSRFACKPGLCTALEHMQWYNQPNISYTYFPRCYVSSRMDQLEAFADDYYLTACMAFLKQFLRLEVLPHSKKSDSISPLVVQFAIERCNEYLATKKHIDIDKQIPKKNFEEWNKFLKYFHLITYKGKKVWTISELHANQLRKAAETVLKGMRKYWPQFEIDGHRNIWIMKPGYNCRGRGIKLMRNLYSIQAVISSTPNTRIHYVLQKYIEKPLLIYETKFDIRQWFLVTSVEPLVIWMYTICYLRFSSQTFSLNNLNESIHLTNNAVQRRYKNNPKRDKNLPVSNMWSSGKFQEYLTDIGQGDKWTTVIYPGMKQAIIGAMLASQDAMCHRSNSFQLYGADFLLSESFTPWLLEINSCPDMAGTTNITAILCPQCLEDVIKVVVDNLKNGKPDTGCFEMVYKQDGATKSTVKCNSELTIEGQRIMLLKNGIIDDKMTNEEYLNDVNYDEFNKKISEKSVAKSETNINELSLIDYHSVGIDTNIDSGIYKIKSVISINSNNDDSIPSTPLVEIHEVVPKPEPVETVDKESETYKGPIISDFIGNVQQKIDELKIYVRSKLEKIDRATVKTPKAIGNTIKQSKTDVSKKSVPPSKKHLSGKSSIKSNKNSLKKKGNKKSEKEDKNDLQSLINEEVAKKLLFINKGGAKVHTITLTCSSYEKCGAKYKSIKSYNSQPLHKAS